MEGRVFLQRFRFPGRDVDSFVIPTSELQSRPEAEICLPDGEPNGIRIDGPQIKIGLLLALESGYDGYVIDEPQIRSNAFLLEDRMAVVLTHRREEELSVAVHVPGYHFVRMDSARGDARLENGRLFLPEYSLCVMLYRKNGC